MANDLLKKKLFATTLLAGIAGGLWAGAAIAQETDSDDEEVTVIEEVSEDDEARQDKVVVTGSRIARDEFSSASPLQVIDGEVARDLGLIDASDLLGQTTVVQGQQTTTGLSTSAGLITDSGPGSATASLRGLDAGRTLVLVNGRRLAPAGVRGAPSAPDLNLIPGSLVERVDVLLDGASSVYGSDAVAGVVNYILRTDIDGLQLDAFVTDPERSNNGGQQQVYSATFGVSNDRGYMTFAGEYSRTQGFKFRDLASFYEPYDGVCRSTYVQGASGEIYEACGGSFGAGAVSGTPLGFLGYDPNGGDPDLPNGFFRIPVTGDLLTPGSVNGAALLLWPEELNQSVAPNFQRITLFSAGEYNLNTYGDMTAYFEASHAIRDTSNSSSGQGRVRFTEDYALNPFDFGATLYFNNQFDTNTEVAQTRLIGGLKGDLPFVDGFGSLKNWGYDIYASYSRSNGDDSIRGIPYFPRLEQTLSNSFIDPTTGQPGCTSRTVTGEGQTIDCRALNFFDPTFILTGRFADEADNEYFFPNRITNTIVEQTVYSGFLTGEVWELPAGPISAVIGAEMREDAIETRTDIGTAGGEFFGFSSDPGSNGDRTLVEAFGELELPLLKDQPMVAELSLNLAGRYTWESNFGEETTYRIQGQYAPVEWLRARASFGTSFRAPNVGEQFGGRVVGFVPAGFTDPCRTPGLTVPFGDYDNDPSTPDTREYQPNLENRTQVVLDNCTNGGGPFNIAPTDPFNLGIGGLGTSNPVFFGANTQQATGSNPDLKAETSEALAGGFVFEQPWIDEFDFRFSVSYYDIEITDEVANLTANDIVNACYNSVGLTDPQCQFVQRSARVPGDETSGEITFVEALNQNLDQRTTRGIDYNVEFDYDFNIPQLEGEIGYSFIGRATNTLEQEALEAVLGGFDENDNLGEYGNPEWRLNLTNIFTYDDWSFLWQSRYIDSMIEDNDPAERNEETRSGFSPCVQAGDGPCLQFDGLDDYWVHDMSVRYETGTWILRGGISNVFDDAPPLTTNNAVRNLAGIGYDLGGRTVFMNITKTF
jgi:iron complex outermembrane receptor protein